MLFGALLYYGVWPRFPSEVRWNSAVLSAPPPLCDSAGHMPQIPGDQGWYLLSHQISPSQAAGPERASQTGRNTDNLSHA